MKALDVIVIDEFSQTSLEILGVLEIIFRQIKKSYSCMGGVLLIFTMDHLQNQPIKERPLLISSQIIPCFQMVSLQFSVRAANDENFRRVKEISRMKHSEIIDENNDCVKEFIDLVSNNCTFVENWDHPTINENTCKLY